MSADARHALDLLDERWREFADLRALADISVQKGGERQRLTGVLLVRGPASLRLEALSPFGQPYLLVVVHEGRLTAYDAAKNEALVGPATAETIAGVLGLPLEPEDLVAVLNTVEEKGGRVYLADSSMEFGKQVSSFGGIVALLRYQIRA